MGLKYKIVATRNRNKIMNKLIGTLLIVSATLMPYVAQAAPTINQITQPFRDGKETTYNARITRYTDEPKSYNQWLAEFRQTDRILNEQISNLWDRAPELHDGRDPQYKAFCIVVSGLSERRLADLWNNTVARNPNSKNARSAFCSYGKDLIVLIRSSIVCDKNFVLDPQQHFVLNKDYPVVKLNPIR